MLTASPVAARSIDEYREFVGDEFIEAICESAVPLEGTRILHLSATPSRAGLSDTLSALVPLLRDIGLVSESRTIRLRPSQIIANRILNRALCGHFVQWTPEMHDHWFNHNDGLIVVSPDDYDFVVVHDVELASIIGERTRQGRVGRRNWIWHCHANVFNAQPDVLDYLMLHTRRYDHRIICCPRKDATGPYRTCSTVLPAVDPFGARNSSLPGAFVHLVLKQYGLDPKRPFVLATLRTDRSFGAISCTINGFRLAKEQVPELQLLGLVTGDTEGEIGSLHFNQFLREVGGRDVRFVPMNHNIGHLESNAFQRGAVAVLEGCDDEDSSTNLLEAMWKARPVITGVENAARLGITDDWSGCVARSAEEFGDKIVRLIERPLIAKGIGEAAKKRVQEDFLTTNLLQAYLTVLRGLAS